MLILAFTSVMFADNADNTGFESPIKIDVANMTTVASALLCFSVGLLVLPYLELLIVAALE
jgi:hypothetical protein